MVDCFVLGDQIVFKGKLIVLFFFIDETFYGNGTHQTYDVARRQPPHPCPRRSDPAESPAEPQASQLLRQA